MFDSVKLVFDHLSLNNISALWQTNFKLTSHPNIGNAYLKAELECQLTVAREQSITVKNLWTPEMSKRVGGFHLNGEAVRMIAEEYFTLGAKTERSRDSKKVTNQSGESLASLGVRSKKHSSDGKPLYCVKEL